MIQTYETETFPTWSKKFMGIWGIWTLELSVLHRNIFAQNETGAPPAGTGTVAFSVKFLKYMLYPFPSLHWHYTNIDFEKYTQ